MSAGYDQLIKLLTEKKTITAEDVEAAEKEHGALTDEEKLQLEAEKHKLEREGDATITMDQYLEATKTLDTAEEGSEEYKKAEAIVEKFESGM
ncbi:MAG: hypothetical protein KC496_20910 [Anaerolineae bacterium]|nr:hypothetical protein [Anaerolineae bacterium]